MCGVFCNPILAWDFSPIITQFSGSCHPEFIVIAYGGTLFCTRTDQTLICECYLVFVYKRDNIIMLIYKPYTCTMCGLYLHCFDRMKQHVKKHKLKYRRTSRSLKMYTSNNNTLQMNTITLMKDGTYLCEVCRKRFLRECNLTNRLMRCLKKTGNRHRNKNTDNIEYIGVCRHFVWQRICTSVFVVILSWDCVKMHHEKQLLNSTTQGQCFILLFSASVATFCRSFSRLKNKKRKVFGNNRQL